MAAPTAVEPPKKERTPMDQELRSIAAIDRLLTKLPKAASRRVLGYLTEKYAPPVLEPVPQNIGEGLFS